MLWAPPPGAVNKIDDPITLEGTVKKQFKELLHRYKVETFKISHATDQAEEISRAIHENTEEILNNAYHYQFHKAKGVEPDAQRVETFNMIKNYTVDALLPPVVEKLMTRIVVLEKQQDRLLDLVHEILETLSHDDLFLDKDAG